MAEAWNIDPVTGDYIMSGGAPAISNSLTIPAYYRLKTKRQQWLYAPDDDFGSDFYLIQKNRSTGDASAIEAVAARALQPIADDGRAISIDVEADQFARQGVSLKLRITDSANRVEQIKINPLEV